MLRLWHKMVRSLLLSDSHALLLRRLERDEGSHTWVRRANEAADCRLTVSPFSPLLPPFSAFPFLQLVTHDSQQVARARQYDYKEE
jgi:hypothetical protein